MVNLHTRDMLTNIAAQHYDRMPIPSWSMNCTSDDTQIHRRAPGRRIKHLFDRISAPEGLSLSAPSEYITHRRRRMAVRPDAHT